MIRSELAVLLDKVPDTALHADLRADVRSQIDRLKQKRSFGLVFEQSIAMVDDDLADPVVRANGRAFQGGKATALYQSECSRPYP